MSEQRVLLIESAAQLSLDHGRLCIAREGQPDAFALPEDLAAVVLHHPAILLSGQALRELAQSGTAVILTDERHLPCAQLWPWRGLAVHGARLRQQMAIDGTERQSGMWAEIVRAKLRNQAATLRALERQGALRLERLAAEVTSKQAMAQEAAGARHYWKHLVGPEFKRERQGAQDAINSRLNFGYTVLRGLVARELAAAGLHPALGLGHRQLENTFNLADDFMEPYRGCVDHHVLAKCDLDAPFTGQARATTVAFIESTVSMGGQTYRLPAAVAESVSSYCRALEREQAELVFPESDADQ
jgi:CRISPR-associated protein Cas1